MCERRLFSCNWALPGFLSTAFPLLSLACLLGGRAFAAEAPTADEEQKLIETLQSDQSLQEKDQACTGLKRIGTDKCIPALSVLLLDPNLSHSARYALEPMSSPKAEQALIEAVKKTKGPIRLGIIGSLGVRGDSAGVPELEMLLKDSDSATAKSAATALGQIGGAKALKLLLAAFHNSEESKEKVPRELTDGLLRCANSLLAAGNQSAALSGFKELFDSTSLEPGVRVAAYAGMVRASGKGGLEMEITALRGTERVARLAALKLASELDIPGTTKALADLLPRIEPRMQSALVEALQRRNDPSAAPAVAALARSESPEVRLAAINALRDLGNEKQAALLAKIAAAAPGDEQNAARLALIELRRGDVTKELLNLLQASEPGAQMEAARALGQRGDRAAVPSLLDLAHQGSAGARKPVLQALASLAGETELPALIDLVAEAKDETTRAEAAEAASAAYQRCQAKTARAPVEPLVAKLNSADPETRAALMPICSGLSSPGIRAALEKGLSDSNPKVHGAAIRALCDTTDSKLLVEVVRVAQQEKEGNFKTLAISACVRLVSPEENLHLSNAERLGPLEAILATSLSPVEKRQVLAGLGEIADLKAFKVVEPMVAQQEVQAEAAQAAVKIAARLTGPNARETLPLLQTIASSSVGENTRQAAAQAINQIQTSADYITTWEIAGPYMQAGKDYSALFDVAFPPEQEGAESSNVKAQGSKSEEQSQDKIGNHKGVAWRKLEISSGQKPWVMDLLKALGGEQRVAYARTWIHCEEDQPALLELGSDDGVKVWLNGRLVHAHNVARPLQEGSDKVNITLAKGWNELLLKVTQNNLGWEFCARLLKPDGSHLESISVASEAAARAP